MNKGQTFRTGSFPEVFWTSCLGIVAVRMVHPSPIDPPKDHRKGPEDRCLPTVVRCQGHSLTPPTHNRGRLTYSRNGFHFYHHRIDYLPVGLWCNTGFVCDMVFPRGRPQGAIGVHAVRAFDGNTSFSSYASLLLLDRYMFAILLGGCRQIMRSGAMWFIKDPQNQNMHPIRDILERPTFTHLYELPQSAITYSLHRCYRSGGNRGNRYRLFYTI
ncbi:hypothetical protein BDM02DRAFT_944681 [Thelephora ganbajun]|uniref:Uncharacterized protein n=1 Tax=Thelephora ganbajun TaxID=370292 RepID=A0ACB6Z499_THEGA|nr:hypothetical protein BDM02DRAFT_944681 [Thelephora ganbajun]